MTLNYHVAGSHSVLSDDLNLSVSALKAPLVQFRDDDRQLLAKGHIHLHTSKPRKPVLVGFWTRGDDT